jgi:nitrogen fixation/metabolism regulation signal transduction histidine kinase
MKIELESSASSASTQTSATPLSSAKRTWSVSLAWRFGLLALLLLGMALATMMALQSFLQWTNIQAAVVSFLLMLPVALYVMYSQVQPMLHLFRTLSGTVGNYQDKDFSFSVYWSRQDELAELVDANNQLANVLRQQRYDLVQRELLLDSMLQNTPVSMLLLGPRGHIVFSNSSARQLLNEGRQLEGYSLAAILRQVAPELSEALANEGDGLFSVRDIKRKNNQDNASGNSESNDEDEDDFDEIFHLSKRRFSLNGNAHELILIRHLTHELRRQEVHTWKKVIRVISHELNNSLAPIASLAQSGKTLVEREQYQRLSQILQTIGERAEHLEQFILSYARFAKLPNPRKVPVYFPEFIQSLKQHVEFVIQGDLPQLNCACDLPQMEQAMLNLLKNAHESGSNKEEVAISARASLDSLRIDVLDRGQGMSETVMANALIPFYSTKRNGTGLGLALAREIVEAHGGRISLAARAEGGLIVSLVLPLQ